jgi:single-stranded-DNA-specific exonuclease
MQAARAFTPAVPFEKVEDDVVESLRVGLNATHTFARLLAARGHVDVARAKSFLDPRLADLTPPESMIDREAAADRLASAVRRRERVVVFGDYDVDGITSCAIVTLALRALGGEAVPVLASRFDGGYGFSARALERVMQASPALIVTCDCGSSDHARLDDARRKGVDAVVIDHHLVPPDPLPAHAFLNPHRPECRFPFKHLASCGLALSLVAAVRTRLGVSFDLRPLLDLVALGTVADVAPLVGDNRALVRAGLHRAATSPRVGIEALAEIAGIAPGASISGEDVSFRLAPRINAPGRLGAPDVALELLLETDLIRARTLAARVEQDCTRRKEIERALVAQAKAQVEETGQTSAPAIVVGGEGWNVGVVGIVAARLVDEFQVPVVVVGFEGTQGRGSVRGPTGSRLYDALQRCASTMIGFGGHQAAAGVHVERTKMESLREAFASACEAITASAHARDGVSDEESDVRTARVSPRSDVALDPRDDPWSVLVDCERLEPCGEGNPSPSLRIQGAEVVSARALKGDSLRLVVRLEGGNGRFLDAFGYGLASHEPARGSIVDLRGRLRRDTYRGRGAVELRITGIDRVS